MDNNELQHWGVRGMKWGFRRYQNKDGSLTTAGKKRYAKEKAELAEREKVIKRKLAVKAKMDKLDTKRKELDEMESTLSGKKSKRSSGTIDSNDQTNVKPAQTQPSQQSNQKTSRVNKPLNKMTDNELKDLAARFEAKGKVEKYLKEQNAKNESAGKKFLKKAFSDIAYPVLVNYGKNKLSDFMNSKGDSTSSERKRPTVSSTVKEAIKKAKTKTDVTDEPETIKAKPSKIFRKFSSNDDIHESYKKRATYDVWNDTPARDVFNNAGLYLDMGRSVVSGLLPERIDD